MIHNTHSVDLTQQELKLIEAALHTQEKILAVQSRAGQDRSAKSRLDDLKSVLRNLRRQTPHRDAPQQSWTQMARTLFG
ncbi:MAG: hypothetical protein ABJL99_18290 [Aliishimia sp.]